MKIKLILFVLAACFIGLSSCDKEVSLDISNNVWIKKLELQRNCENDSMNHFQNFDCDYIESCNIYEYTFETDNTYSLLHRQEQPTMEIAFSSGTYTYSESNKLILCDTDQNCQEYKVEFYKKYMDWTFTIDGCDVEIQFSRN